MLKDQLAHIYHKNENEHTFMTSADSAFDSAFTGALSMTLIFLDLKPQTLSLSFLFLQSKELAT